MSSPKFHSIRSFNNELFLTSSPIALSGLLNMSTRQLINRAVHATSPQIPSVSMSRCTALELAIPAIIKGDASRASGLYRGIFELAGCKVVLAGTSVFELPGSRPISFDHALNSFDWLQDLHAGNTQLYRVFARGLIAEWLELKTYRTPAARDVQTLAKRIINWIQCAPYLLKGASEGFEIKFFDSLTRQTRLLARRGIPHYTPANRLMSALALAFVSFGTAGLDGFQKTAMARLSLELDQQILPDGGHVSRSGESLVDLLVLLIPLRDALVKARMEVPGKVNAAIDRMLPMLRFMSHHDGGLAVFNGVSRTSIGKIKAILDRDDVRGRPLESAPFSGYSRLAHGRATVVMDTGSVPAPGQNKGAACSPLAFELCDGAHRIVVNCGSKHGSDAQWQSASRLTSAHSTITIANRDTYTVLDNAFTHRLFNTPILMGSGEVKSETQIGEPGSIITAQHSAYEKAFGIIHHRQLFLDASGTDLRGEDRLIQEDPASIDPGHEFAIRFHLHPSVKATMSRDGGSIMMLLPNKTGWRFSARGGLLAIEPSVYLPNSRCARATSQIVISGITGRPEKVAWAFKRMSKASKSEKLSQDNAPELPLSTG